MKNRFFILVLLAFIFVIPNCSKFSQQTEQPASQENLFELLNGIKDKADVEGLGILEYELYDIPGNESADFQAFIRSYTKSLDEYVFDYTDKRWIEDNTELSINVKILMINHNRNLSITQILNPDGYASFIFNCLNSNGKYEFYAINAYKKYISSTPKTTEKFISRDFAEAYIRRGRAYYWKGDYDLAIADFTEAIRLDPKNTEAYSTRGWAFFCKYDYDLAISDFTKLIIFDPKSADAYYGRGQAYYWKDDYDKAIADYTAAIRFYPKFTEAYISRGRAYHWKENYDRAITDFIEVIQLDPKNAKAYLWRGDAYYWKEDYNRAIVDYSEAIRLYPGNAETYIWRGRAYYWKEDYDQSIEDLTEALQINSNDAFAYYYRGDAYYDKGDYDKAISDYEAALRIDPNDTDIKQALEDARQMLQARKEQQ